MSYKKLIVKRSSIEGYGLYANEYIRRGEIIMFWAVNAYLIPEDEYNFRQSEKDQQIIATGARYVGPMFLYTDVGPNKDRYENYINHSFTPNVLYHCGVCFALEDIDIGIELTTNYTYLLAEGDSEAFYDLASKKQVCGIGWRECLKQTAVQLFTLFDNPTILERVSPFEPTSLKNVQEIQSPNSTESSNSTSRSNSPIQLESAIDINPKLLLNSY